MAFAMFVGTRPSSHRRSVVSLDAGSICDYMLEDETEDVREVQAAMPMAMRIADRGTRERIVQLLRHQNAHLPPNIQIAYLAADAVPARAEAEDEDNIIEHEPEWPLESQLVNIANDAEARVFLALLEERAITAIYVNYDAAAHHGVNEQDIEDEESSEEDADAEDSEEDADDYDPTTDDETPIARDALDDVQNTPQRARRQLKIAFNRQSPRKIPQWQNWADDAHVEDEAENEYEEHKAKAQAIPAPEAAMRSKIAMKALEHCKITFAGNADADVYTFDRDMMQFAEVHNLSDEVQLQLLLSGIMIKGAAYRRLMDHARMLKHQPPAQQVESIRKWLKNAYDRPPQVETLRLRLFGLRQGAHTKKQYRVEWAMARENLEREINIQRNAGRVYHMPEKFALGRAFCHGLNQESRAALESKLSVTHEVLDLGIDDFLAAIQDLERTDVWRSQFRRGTRSQPTTRIHELEAQVNALSNQIANNHRDNQQRYINELENPRNTEQGPSRGRGRRGRPQGAEKIPCRHGPSCHFHRQNRCWFLHEDAPQHTYQVDQLQACEPLNQATDF